MRGLDRPGTGSSRRGGGPVLPRASSTSSLASDHHRPQTASSQIGSRKPSGTKLSLVGVGSSTISSPPSARLVTSGSPTAGSPTLFPAPMKRDPFRKNIDHSWSPYSHFAKRKQFHTPDPDGFGPEPLMNASQSRLEKVGIVTKKTEMKFVERRLLAEKEKDGVEKDAAEADVHQELTRIRCAGGGLLLLREKAAQAALQAN